MFLGCLGELREYQKAEARPSEVDPPLESKGPEALIGECVRFFIFISGTPCNRQRDVAEPQLFAELHEPSPGGPGSRSTLCGAGTPPTRVKATGDPS